MWAVAVMIIALLIYAVIWDLIVKPQKIKVKESPFTSSPINSVK